MTNFKYPKAEKLKKKNHISVLFEKGKWKSAENIRIITLKEPADIELKNNELGVSVSKKNFKKAVDRNRVKRLLRECYRLNKDLYRQSFGEKNIAMLFWASKKMPESFREVEAQFLQLCQAQKKKEKNPQQ
jgi:ribonuclease P protein component